MTAEILSLIDAEIASLQQARALIALASMGGSGRPKSVIIPTEKPVQKQKISPKDVQGLGSRKGMLS